MRRSPGSPGPFADNPLKWVGVVTALLSVLLLLNQVSKVYAEIRDRERQVGELQAMADRQQRAGAYRDAWASLERAAVTANQGSYLARLASPEAGRQAVRDAQQDLAMAWIERASAAGGARFSDTVDPLLPALTDGAATAAGRRKADLLAHAGWAHFLKSRDGGAEAQDPEPFYREALAVDPSNPYAHAHWGHWLAWKGRPIDDAAAHFDAGLASGRARPYVRSVQLAALQLGGTAAGQGAFLAAVADMVKNQEAIDPAVRDAVYALFTRAFDDETRFDRLAAAVPPAAQIAVIRALFFDLDFDPARVPPRDAWLARLQDAAVAAGRPALLR